MITVDELIMLRSLVHAGGPVPAGTEVIRREGAIDHVRVPLDSPITVDDLAAGFGPGRDVPRQPAGGRRVIFPDTQPGEGQRAVTVIAELDRSGQVTTVVLRPDDFT
ncbi:hypothetical protein JOF56_010485 [Kibdelosporangium banguiense]|uniref:Uncharacterized protein n=1 Tax=Kibdelosporangium banguiense TaxID=1365924 RepID=A0ABS4U0D0_9PSEU|nr:hypothetical protein [Kibdelosporangium banguiense]MBP2330100.1 hypothetical protein [Kibdelosporangium banguiense]